MAFGKITVEFDFTFVIIVIACVLVATWLVVRNRKRTAV
jgi:hypothetical protein